MCGLSISKRSRIAFDVQQELPDFIPAQRVNQAKPQRFDLLIGFIKLFPLFGFHLFLCAIEEQFDALERIRWRECAVTPWKVVVCLFESAKHNIALLQVESQRHVEL